MPTLNCLEMNSATHFLLRFTHHTERVSVSLSPINVCLVIQNNKKVIAVSCAALCSMEHSVKYSIGASKLPCYNSHGKTHTGNQAYFDTLKTSHLGVN